MLVATLFVAVMPVAVVWALRAKDVISSWWVCVLVAVALSVAAAVAGSAFWQRRQRSGDVMFSELLVWGWLRRIRIERNLTTATELLGLTDTAGEPPAGTSVEQSEKLLRQLAAAVEAQDAYTLGHSRRVARNATLVARRMGLSDKQVATVRAASAVHDVGKLHIPRELLNKPGRLTDAEFEVVKGHAEEGAAMVACLGDPELAAIVRHHHERVDGTGYPSGLAGEEIPIGARILAVADTFDAITSTRPYRPAAAQKRAIDALVEESGTHFDPHVVQAFLSRYSGAWALTLWAAFATAPQLAFAWKQRLRGTRRPASSGQSAATAAVIAAAAAAVALAAPVSLKRQQVHHPPPPAAVAVVPPALKRPAPRRAVVAKVQTPSPTPTCQAYNPQLCFVVGTATSPGSSSASGASSSGGTVVDAASGVLPFTGIDVRLLALLGCLLVSLGVGLRRRAGAPDESGG